jgi:hypothetical protein
MGELHRFFADLFSDGTVLRRGTDEPAGRPAHEEIRAFIDHLLRITA